VITHSRWGINFDEGHPARLLIYGTWHAAEGEAYPDPDAVAKVIHQLLAARGLRFAPMVGLTIQGDDVPTHEEIKMGVLGSRLIKFQLERD
jgi:hypothetical protein